MKPISPAPTGLLISISALHDRIVFHTQENRSESTCIIIVVGETQQQLDTLYFSKPRQWDQERHGSILGQAWCRWPPEAAAPLPVRSFSCLDHRSASPCARSCSGPRGPSGSCRCGHSSLADRGRRSYYAARRPVRVRLHQWWRKPSHSHSQHKADLNASGAVGLKEGKDASLLDLGGARLARLRRPHALAWRRAPLRTRLRRLRALVPFVAARSLVVGLQSDQRRRQMRMRTPTSSSASSRQRRASLRCLRSCIRRL